MNRTGRLAPPAIELSHVTLGYLGRPVLKDVSWLIPPGSLIALVGPNGGGKSTLLKAIAGELTPINGRIDRNGGDPRSLGYLPQTVEFDRDFPISARDVVAMGLWSHLGPFGRIGNQHAEIVATALQTMGFTGLENKLIGQLSGGELQRVLFARLIAMDAPIILLDEPFAAIDRETISGLIALIRRWHQEGRTIIAALHDLDQVRRFFPKTMRLTGGRGIFWSTAEILGLADSLSPPNAGALN